MVLVLKLFDCEFCFEVALKALAVTMFEIEGETDFRGLFKGFRRHSTPTCFKVAIPRFAGWILLPDNGRASNPFVLEWAFSIIHSKFSR